MTSTFLTILMVMNPTADPADLLKIAKKAVLMGRTLPPGVIMTLLTA